MRARRRSMLSFDEKLFPELLLFEPGKERRRMKRLMIRNSRTVTACIFFVVIFIAGVRGILRNTLAQLGLPNWALTLAGSICAGAAVYVAIWASRRRIRRYLREQLVIKGVSVCLNCGYQLRGQVEPRCPECGTGFDMRLPPQNRTSNE